MIHRARTALAAAAITVLMVAIRLSLKTWGLGKTMRAFRFLSQVRSSTVHLPHDRVRALSGLVDRVGTVFPGRAQCLERSMTTALLLRWLGVSAELRLGARLVPFFSHAWVEVDGEPVDGEEWVTRLRPFRVVS